MNGLAAEISRDWIKAYGRLSQRAKNLDRKYSTLNRSANFAN